MTYISGPERIARHEMNVLAALKHECLRFETLYRVPSRLSDSACPPASFGLSKLSTPNYVIPQLRSPHVHNELNRLASYALQFDTLYHEIKVPASKPEFLVPRRSRRAVHDEQTRTDAELTELNRLARLVEMSHDQAPIYPTYTPISRVHQTFDSKLRYGKGMPSPIDSRLRKKLNLNPDTLFKNAFPGFTPPKVTLVNCLPTIEKKTFTTLLEYKLAPLANYSIPNTPRRTSPVSSYNGLTPSFVTSSVPRLPPPLHKRRNKDRKNL